MNKENNITRIKQLDGMRFIMFLFVFINHFDFFNSTSEQSYIFSKFFTRGDLAVDFFFVLSGFGIYCAYNSKISDASIKKSIGFAISKIKKIYPAYIASLLFGLVYQIPNWINATEHNFSPLVYILEYPLTFLFSLTLTQSLTGMTAFTHAINSSCWFLSSLFISYMFCPLFIKIVNSIKKKKELIVSALITFLLIMLLSYIGLLLDGKLLYGKIDELFYCHPFIRCLYLLIGMYISKIVISKNKSNYRSFVCEYVSLIIVVLYIVFRGLIIHNALLQRLTDLLIVIILFFFLTNSDNFITRFLSSDKLVKLGNDSMYYFLFHYPSIRICDILFKIINVKINNNILIVIKILIIIGLTILITIVYKKNSEKIKNIINPFFDRILHVFMSN